MSETAVLTAQSPSIGAWSAPPSVARVLHLVNGEHFAGAERVQDLLAMRLRDHGFDVAFACLKPDRFPLLRASQEALLWKTSMRFRGDLRPVYEVARLLEREGFDLLHTHTPRTALIGRWAARWAGKPFVHHLHSPTIADTTFTWRNRINASVERWSMKKAAGVIAVSHSLGAYARRLGVPENRLAVVHNGVTSDGPRRDSRMPQAPWKLGVVALFRPRKGLETLLDALALLRDRGHVCQLRAVGSFETRAYEAQIHARVEELQLSDQIDWRGFRSDVRSELAAMDLFVLPSLFGEGLPMVVLEAMATGLPVVGTDVEGVPEAVRHGVDGLIVKPGDARSLADGIESFIEGKVNWMQLRENGRHRQAERFSDSAMAAGVADLYRRVLDV